MMRWWWISFLAFQMGCLAFQEVSTSQCPADPDEEGLLQVSDAKRKAKRAQLNQSNQSSERPAPPNEPPFEVNVNDEYLLEVKRVMGASDISSATQTFASLDLNKNGFLDAEEMQQGFVDKDKLEAKLAAQATAENPMPVPLSEVRPSLESMQVLILRAEIIARSGCENEVGFNEGVLNFAQFLELLSEDAREDGGANENATGSTGQDGSGSVPGSVPGSAPGDHSFSANWTAMGWQQLPPDSKGIKVFSGWREVKDHMFREEKRTVGTLKLLQMSSGSLEDRCLGKNTFDEASTCFRDIEVKECIKWEWKWSIFKSVWTCTKEVVKIVAQAYECIKQATEHFLGSFKSCAGAVFDEVKNKVAQSGFSQDIQDFMDFLPSCDNPKDCKDKLLEGPQQLREGLTRSLEGLVEKATGDDVYQPLWDSTLKTKEKLDASLSEVNEAITAAARGVADLLEGDFTSQYDYDIDLSGDVCFPWVDVQLTDCNAFDAMRELFDFSNTRVLTDIKNHLASKVNTIVDRFSKCLSKTSFLGVPTPFADISVNAKYICLDNNAKNSIKKVLGPVSYFLARLKAGSSCAQEQGTELSICKVAEAIAGIPSLLEPFQASLLESQVRSPEHGSEKLKGSQGREHDNRSNRSKSQRELGSHDPVPSSVPSLMASSESSGISDFCNGRQDWSVYVRGAVTFFSNVEKGRRPAYWRQFLGNKIWPFPFSVFIGGQGSFGCRSSRWYGDFNLVFGGSLDFVQAFRAATGQFDSTESNSIFSKSFGITAGFSVGQAPTSGLFGGSLELGGSGRKFGRFSGGTGVNALMPSFFRGGYIAGAVTSSGTEGPYPVSITLTASLRFCLSCWIQNLIDTGSPPAGAPNVPSGADFARPIITRYDATCLGWNFNTNNVYFGVCHGLDNQQWYFDGALLKTARDPTYCLDQDQGGINNLYMFPCHGRDNQLFRMEASTGYLKVASSDLCADYNFNNGNFYMGNCHGGKNQQVQFQCYPRRKTDARVFSTFLNDQCLDYNYNTGNVYMYDQCHRLDNQQWYFDQGQLKTRWDDNLCLEKTGRMNTCDGSSDQQFIFNGAQIRHVNTGLCADVGGNRDVYFNTCAYNGPSQPRSWQRWRCRS